MSEPGEDTQCVIRCLGGDPAAFEPLVERYERRLLAVAFRLLGNYEDARDATQNAFIRAYERLETYDPERRFFSWICRIVVNESLNLRRGRRPTEVLAETPVDGGGFEAVSADEVRQEVERAIDRLPADQRTAIVLRYFGELSYQEISETTHVPEKTVKSRLFEARRRLAELMTTRQRDLR